MRPKTGMASFGSMLRDIPGQRGHRPKFRRQTQILGLGTSDGHHPFTCFLADLGHPRTMRQIFQAGFHAGSQGVVNALVDGWLTLSREILDLHDGSPLRIMQQNPSSVRFTYRTRFATGSTAQVARVRLSTALKTLACCSVRHDGRPSRTGHPIYAKC